MSLNNNDVEIMETKDEEDEDKLVIDAVQTNSGPTTNTSFGAVQTNSGPTTTTSHWCSLDEQWSDRYGHPPPRPEDKD